MSSKSLSTAFDALQRVYFDCLDDDFCLRCHNEPVSDNASIVYLIARAASTFVETTAIRTTNPIHLLFKPRLSNLANEHLSNNE